MGWRTASLRARSVPNLLSYAATGSFEPGFSRLHLSGGTGWLIEAILVRLGGIHRGSSSAATVDGARRGSRGALGSRRPGNHGRVVAVGSRHWLK